MGYIIFNITVFKHFELLLQTLVKISYTVEKWCKQT